MNSFERLQSQLKGESIDRVLNFDLFMTFLPKLIGKTQREYYLNYKILSAGNLAARDQFKIDILQTISDPYREAADAGLNVEFPENSLPLSREPLLQTPEDLSNLRFPEPGTGRRMSDRLEAISALQAQAHGEVPVMGWVEGALAEAADLRGINNLMVDLVDRPEWVKELLEITVEAEIAFARAQIRAGADIIGLGDAIASQISPRMYKKFALPYEQRIFQAVQELGAIPRLHICGDTTKILPDMALSGAQIIDLDWMVDMEYAFEVLDKQLLCGNLDPVTVFLQGTPADIRAGLEANYQAAAPRWISMAGCEIPEDTPIENLLAQTIALGNLH
jgi:uroporphyrinogen decarboxylase